MLFGIHLNIEKCFNWIILKKLCLKTSKLNKNGIVWNVMALNSNTNGFPFPLVSNRQTILNSTSSPVLVSWEDFHHQALGNTIKHWDLETMVIFNL